MKASRTITPPSCWVDKLVVRYEHPDYEKLDACSLTMDMSRVMQCTYLIQDQPETTSFHLEFLGVQAKNSQALHHHAHICNKDRE